MHERWPRWLAASAIVLSLCAPRPLIGQGGLGHLDDATVAPRGHLRIRAITVWNRFDSRFTASGTTALGAPFTTDSLGSRQVGALGATESLVQSTAASPFVLSLGRSRLDARAREEVVPIGLEYGLTDRVSVGLIVPIVRRRVAVQFRLDSTGANVGPNRQRFDPAVQQNNTLLQTQFEGAAAQLEARLQSCQANPAGAGCATLLARQSEAQLLILSSRAFAGDLAALYGGGISQGMAFVPITQSGAQTAIELRVADYNARYRDLLATSTNPIPGRPTPAGGPAGSSEFQQYLTRELDRDSLATEERSGIGDVEVGVTALLLDRVRSETRRLGTQLSVQTSVRLPTGSRQSPSEIADLRLGTGLRVAGRAALDVSVGRLGLLSVADLAYAPDTAGGAGHGRDTRTVGIHVAPRYHLSAPLSFHAAYSLRTADVSGGQQFVGGGVTYSTLAAYRANGGPLPLEMRFTHLEAVSGDAGTAKTYRDQIEVRLYYRLLRR